MKDLKSGETLGKTWMGCDIGGNARHAKAWFGNPNRINLSLIDLKLSDDT